jgi:F420-dependent oxidoreductase-like protein
MKFSFWTGPGNSWNDLLALGQHADKTGWDGLWFADHFMPNTAEAAGPTAECWTTLAAWAATVPRVRLGALVTGNTYRHPAVLANMAANVDNISGGRVVLGLGAGWQENEHQKYGIPFYTLKERMDRLEEACQVVKGLLGGERATFSGHHYQLDDAPNEPKPAQSPLPLLIGGGGEKRTMRIAAKYADEWNVWGTPEILAQKGQVLEKHCADLGRDPKEIRRSAQALLFLTDDASVVERARQGGRPVIAGNVEQVSETVAAYRDAGVDEIIIPDFSLGRELGAKKQVMDTFIAEVAPAFR